MWGIEFRKDTSNSLICASAVFELRTYGSMGIEYKEMRVRWHPDIGIAIDERDDDNFKCIKNHAEPKDVEDILPKKNDFGYDWTYANFVLAMTFFGEGYKLGNEIGYRRGLKQGRLQCNR